MNRTLVLVSLVSSLHGYLPAQQTQVSGPVEGFTFDGPTGSFRPVIGLPGSASLGSGVSTIFERGYVAPRQNYGLAFKDETWAVVTGLGTAQISVSALSGAFGSPEGVVWSGDGSTAVLFSRSKNWIRNLGGLPGAATAGESVDLSFLTGSLSAIAADTTGKRIAIGVAGESGGVYLMTDGGSPIPVLASSKPTALAFSSDGRELYSVDGATLQITALQLADFTSDSFPLDGLTDPIAIKPARDAANRRVLFVAGRKDYLLRVYDAAGHQVLTDIPLDFPPSELGDFGRNSFLLAPRTNGNDPLWLFTATPQPAVYFVPAGPASSGESQ